MPATRGKLKSETVEAIQTRLAELGYYREELHGDLDEATMRALEAFQRNLGLSADGIANPETWQHLFDGDNRPEGYAFEEILKKELFEIDLSRKRRQRHPHRIRPKGKKATAAAHEAQLIGLAFSGGGIRSATYNLGVLQALAELKLLGLFDYLSTVSGGGYIGSWLVALIKREHSLEKVEAAIAGGSSEVTMGQQSGKGASRMGPEPAAISFLRRYSNYITPKAGLFSSDTWCVVSTYLRNLTLNLLILSAGLGSLILIPRLLVRGFRWFDQVPVLFLLAPVALLLAISLFAIAVNLVPSAARVSEKVRFYACPKWILWGITVPVVAAALLISYVLAFVPALNQTRWSYWALGGVTLYLVLWVLCWLAGQLFLRLVATVGEESKPHPDLPADEDGENSQEDSDRALKTVVPLYAPLAGLAGGCLFWGSAWLLTNLFSEAARLWNAVTLGPPLVILVFSATIALHIGLMGRDFPDARREWWSRLGGWLLMVVVVWVGWFGIALGAPLVLHSAQVSEWVRWSLASGWLASTLAGVLVGKSPAVGKQHPRNWVDLVIRITPAVFVVGLLTLLSLLIDSFLNFSISRQLPAYICDRGPAGTHFSHSIACHVYMMNLSLDGRLLFYMFLGLLGMTVLLSLRVDINEFSLHHLYRNRLIRCYLGASNRTRKPQPFTGFCAGDDLALKALAPSHPDPDGIGYRGPYPIINAALNLVAGKELAWQKRKAASFVFTPRFCGYELPVLEAITDDCGADPDHRLNGCYRPTARFAGAGGGTSLGTALAISGAAASPNMGYHSSPPLAFLLTVFNVRLGWWMGNPARSRWMNPSPRFGLRYLAQELFGFAGAESSFVYLSDGGHFENLGLYELVRRRCRLILACDATQDGAYAFSDLGGAIRKCYTDLGIPIAMDVNPIRPHQDPARSLWHCAIGTIHYERADCHATPGTLIYLKASLTGDESTDLLSYHSQHPDFPHQSTADQWFDESQFESYRRLGHHTVKTVFQEAVGKLRGTGATSDEIDPESLLAELRQAWYPPRIETKEAFARHGRALDEIFERIRTDENLHFLDGEIYPEWESLTPDRPEPANKGPQWWLPGHEAELRSAFYLCNSVIQLMESIYLELNLEQDHDHPDNRGWMNLFRHWSWSAMFRATWAISACNYGARFQGFCERRLGIELGKLEVSHRLSLKEAGAPFLNVLEQHLLGALLTQNPALKEDALTVIPLQLVVSPPIQEWLPLIAFTFGFTVLDRTGNILYFRVRDHLRTMGLARLALKELIQSGVVRAIDLRDLSAEALEVPSPDERRRFASLFQSVRLERPIG